jgi:hypothetical protein
MTRKTHRPLTFQEYDFCKEMVNFCVVMAKGGRNPKELFGELMLKLALEAERISTISIWSNLEKRSIVAAKCKGMIQIEITRSNNFSFGLDVLLYDENRILYSRYNFAIADSHRLAAIIAIASLIEIAQEGEELDGELYK